MRKWFRRWINTPPEDTFFFTRMRKVKQLIWPCKHEWEEDRFKRKCKWCGKRQILVYHPVGEKRQSWVTLDY